MNVGMQLQDHVSKTLSRILILRYDPHVQPRPSQGRVCSIPRLEVDDVNQSELFCAVSTVSKAGIKPPHPLSPSHGVLTPHSLLDLLQQEEALRPSPAWRTRAHKH